MSAVSVRRLARADWPTAFELHEVAFGRTVRPAEGAAWLETLDLDLSSVACDAGVVVGMQCGFRAEIRRGADHVPVVVGCFAAVSASARGRGVYRQLFSTLCDEARALDAAAVVFNVSSARVFRALGGQPVGICADVRFGPQAVGEFADRSARFEVQTLPASQSVERCRAIYDACVPSYPGVAELTSEWWKSHTGACQGQFPVCAVVQRDGVDEGYVRYGVEDAWIAGRGAGTIEAQELVGSCSEARDALVVYLAAQEHVTGGVIRKCRLDDGLRWARSGLRGMRVELLYDHVWAVDLWSPPAFGADVNVHCPFEI